VRLVTGTERRPQSLFLARRARCLVIVVMVAVVPGDVFTIIGHSSTRSVKSGRWSRR
jgi:hypothetical protein